MTASVRNPQKFLAALGTDALVADRVLKSALSVAHFFGAAVEGLHIDEGTGTHDGAARIAHGLSVPLRRTTGRVADRLLEALNDPEVFGLVLGTRDFQLGPVMIGHDAYAVLAGSRKPTVFVPPRAHIPPSFHHLLVPLDGTAGTSKAFLELEERMLPGRRPVVSVLHTGTGKMPMLIDRPGHDLSAWGAEPVAPHRLGESRDLRFDSGEDAALAILGVAKRTSSDLIVLPFHGEVANGHAATVRAVVSRALVPVMVLRSDKEVDGARITTGSEADALRATRVAESADASDALTTEVGFPL